MLQREMKKKYVESKDKMKPEVNRSTVGGWNDLKGEKRVLH